jgi:hypothetical protein
MFRTIFGILVSVALLWWLGSLAREYFTNPTERSRLNNQPGQLLLTILGAAFLVMGIVGICIPRFGELAISVGGHQLRVWAIGLIGCAVLTAFYFMSGKA